MNNPPPTVLCFGEILWDSLPAGLFPGGAPFNVACHLAAHGVRVHVVSAIGCDALGDELLRRMAARHLATDGLTRHPDRPTGCVHATLGPGGQVTYQILTDVAWDLILPGPATQEAAASARALVYGSLAQRSPLNRTALNRLLAALPPEAERVFDVNLRPPHDDLPLVYALARHATLLKLNLAEATRLLGESDSSPATALAHARALAARTRCATVCLTAGENGAGLLAHDRWHWEPARPVQVADPVGAGDAFLAALLAHRLAGSAPATALAHACRLGEYVATQPGATPLPPAALVAV